MLPQDLHIEGRQVKILPAWREKVAAELTRLQKHYHGPILHARVEIIGTAHHRRGAFEVHLVVNVPGDTITVKRQGPMVLSLLIQAFDSLDRSLHHHSLRAQQQVKTHEDPAKHGIVMRLFPQEDYGFIESEEGQEVYFHAHAVKHGRFRRLTLGTPVKFAQEAGDQGLQAIWVQTL
jgi:cold shock CspA family protein/ribosome-associated translation inhibitor RaiA